MAQKKVSFTQLTHDVVFAAEEPLPFAEIMARVEAITPITTKNPKNTIRTAVSNSRMIVFTGDGRYGWKPRLSNGALLRHTLQEMEIREHKLIWDQELLDAICPTFYAKKMYSDRDPVTVLLPDGRRARFTLQGFGGGQWGTPADDNFWDWFATQGPQPGDHLLLTVLDGEAKQYAIRFQPRSARDESEIAARNHAFIELGRKEFNRRSYGVSPWDFAAFLLASGFYRHPVPPDAFSALWPEALPAHFRARQPDETESVDIIESVLQQMLPGVDIRSLADLFSGSAEPARRQPRPSRKAKRGPVTSYLLRIHHRALPDVWRDLLLAEDNTLEDLHLLIQEAFGWDDDHVYSFFMSGVPFDGESEIGGPWSEAARTTDKTAVGDLNLRPQQTFLYLFDFGDNHEFDITVRAVDSPAPRGAYPRIVDRHGESPPQYPDIDEESGEWSWDPYAHWK